MCLEDVDVELLRVGICLLCSVRVSGKVDCVWGEGCCDVGRFGVRGNVFGC